MKDINRFLVAQENVYPKALQEIKMGHKKTHWMWFIFPQVIGLGESATSDYYAISSIEEAESYLNHPLLRARLFEITEALLNLDISDPVRIFPYPDHLKLHSSMTLFNYIEPQSIFKKVLDKYFAGEEDMATLAILHDMEMFKKKLKPKWNEYE